MRKPWSDTSSRYGPIGRFGISQLPVSSVTVVRVKRGVGLSRRHRDAGQDGAALVGDAAVHLRRALRRRGAGDEQDADDSE